MADEPRLTMSEAKDKIEELRNRAKRMAEKADGVIEKTVTAAVTMGAGGLVGLIEGYNGEEFKLGQVDGAAALAIGAHGLAAMGDSKYSDQIHAAGNGFGTVWSYKTMRKVGERMKKNKVEKGSVFGAQPEPPQLPNRAANNNYGDSPAAIVVHQAAE